MSPPHRKVLLNSSITSYANFLGMLNLLSRDSLFWDICNEHPLEGNIDITRNNSLSSQILISLFCIFLLQKNERNNGTRRRGRAKQAENELHVVFFPGRCQRRNKKPRTEWEKLLLLRCRIMWRCSAAQSRFPRKLIYKWCSRVTYLSSWRE